MKNRRAKRAAWLAGAAFWSVLAWGGALATEPAPPQGFSIEGPAPYCDATVLRGPNPRGASSAAPTGAPMILVDPAVLAGLPYVRPFVMAHECGHHALGHTSPAGLLREGSEFREKELAADCWAAAALVAAGDHAPLQEQIAIFQARGDSRPGPRYPRFGERAERMAACAMEAGER